LLLWCVAGCAAIPGLLLTLYYTHIFDGWLGFYRFRAMPLTELAAGGLGLLAGLLAVTLAARTRSGELVRWLCGGALLLWIAVPYVKPVVNALDPGELHDEWRDDVCLQSTESSCGPAAAATLLRAHGVQAREAELARECFTSRGGTENWYLARAIRRRGLRVDYVSASGLDDVPLPCIAGVRLGGPQGDGHFIAILGRSGERFVTGDPRLGRFLVSEDELARDYHFTGFFMASPSR